jgi:hypothetical protein
LSGVSYKQQQNEWLSILLIFSEFLLASLCRYSVLRLTYSHLDVGGSEVQGVIAMLAKCANPECNSQFHFFRDGRIFQFDISRSAKADGAAKPSRKVEHFWLCGRCAERMTMKLEKHKGPVLVRLPHMTRKAAA